MLVLLPAVGWVRKTHASQHFRGPSRRDLTKCGVKVYLTNDQVLSLLRIGARRNLWTVRSIQSTEQAHMNNIQVITRFAQGLLAAGVTTAAVLVFQFAMVAG